MSLKQLGLTFQLFFHIKQSKLSLDKATNVVGQHKTVPTTGY